MTSGRAHIVSGALLLALLGGYPVFMLASHYGVPVGGGTYFHFHTDEFHKMGEIAVAMKGNYLLGNPFVYEERDGATSNTPYAPAFAALLFRASGLSIATSSWLLDFVMPALAFLLVVLLFRRLFPSADPCALPGVAFLFTLVFLMAPSQRGMMRYMQSQMTMPYFLYLYLATILLEARRVGPDEFAVMLIMNAAGPLIDIWFSLVVTATQSLLLLWNLARRDGERARAFALLAAAVVVGGSPEFLRLLSTARLPGFAMLQERMGGMRTFVPSYPVYMIWIAVLGVLVALGARAGFLRAHRTLARVSLLTLGFCTALYFQNLVTFHRLYFQGEHLAGNAMIPAGLLVCAMLLSLFDRIPSVNLRPLLLAVLMLAAAAHHHYEVRKVLMPWLPADRADEIYGYDPMRIEVLYRPALEWLRARGADTDVVFAEPGLDMMTRLIADRFSYAPRASVHVSLNQQGIIERYYPFLWLRGQVRIATAKDTTWHMDEQVTNYDPRDYNLLYASAGSALPHQSRINAFFKARGWRPVFDEEETRRKFQANIDALYDGYDSFVAGRSLSGLRDLLKYKCDWVLWGPQEKFFYARYDPDADSTIEKVFTDEGHDVRVYRVRP